MTHTSSETEIYMKNGADTNLAIAIACALEPTLYAPRYKTVDDRAKNASTVADFKGLCLDMMLRGMLQEARDYLQIALNTEDPKRIVEFYYVSERRVERSQFLARVQLQILLDKLNDVPKVLIDSMGEIDRLRSRNGYASLYNYIDGLFQCELCQR